jgi:cytochrome P450
VGLHDGVDHAARLMLENGVGALPVVDGSVPVGVVSVGQVMGGADSVVFRLFGAEGRVDPYPCYHQLRELAPLHRSVLGATLATRYRDCADVLRDPRFGKYQTQGSPPASMLNANPPDHTRLRRLVSRAFTQRRVEGLRAHITRRVDELVSAMADRGEVDVMNALAFPLPVSVIGEMLGVPPADRPQFQGLVRDSTATLELVVTAADRERARAARTVIEAYFLELFAERRARPGADLLSALIAAEEAGDTLSEEELLATVVLLFAAGFETTTNLIANGLVALLAHPDQLARLRREPQLMRAAVEELLRYDTPNHVQGRQATQDLELGGTPVAAGEIVITLLGAANRDPARYPDPDRLDVARPDAQPLSFGGGIHHCLGAPLARLECEIALSALLRRFGAIELAGTPVRRPSLALRGFVSLPVRLVPA